jgi:hypothetical protein
MGRHSLRTQCCLVLLAATMATAEVLRKHCLRSSHHLRPTDDAFTPRIQTQVRGERRNHEPLFRCGGWAFDLSSGFLSRFRDASAQAQGACTSLDFKNRGTSI